MSTVHLRKERAGSDSWGHDWPEDGAVVEVDYDQAMVLLAIPDAGFTVVDKPAPKQAKKPELSEVAPEPEPDASPDSKPAPRRGGRPRKNTEVEEG